MYVADTPVSCRRKSPSFTRTAPTRCRPRADPCELSRGVLAVEIDTQLQNLCATLEGENTELRKVREELAETQRVSDEQDITSAAEVSSPA